MGVLYWITGLSGSGKTTVARELHKMLKAKKHNVIFLDGDSLRNVFNSEGLYTPQDRLKLGLQYSKLCKLLTEQEFDVICATISLFKECHQWNRKHIPDYREIYLRVPIDILIKRDSKNIYSRALKKELNYVMGIDISFQEPESPDLIIDNDSSRDPLFLARKIYEHFYKIPV